MTKKNKTYQLTVAALMAAVCCLAGPLAVPVGAVPISLTNLVVYLAVMLLGMKWGTVSYLVYLALGAVGLPVFSGYAGGPAKLFGPTGGYLVGFALMALIGGLFLEKSKGNLWWTALGMALGTLVDYVLGTGWFMLQMGTGLWQALTICVFPFVLGDALKIAAAVWLGGMLRTRLTKAGFLKAL